MQVTICNGGITVAAEPYMLTFPVDRPFVLLKDASGTQLAELFVLSSVHPLHARDDTVRIEDWETVEQDDEIVLTLRAYSSAWEEKRYRFRCRPHRFTYEMEVVGEGQLAEVHLFGGYYSGGLRWGSGFFSSGQSFAEAFNPEPNADEMNFFSPAESSVIDMSGVPLPGRASWFFTPPPFCFAFRSDSQWVSMGVEAAAGANRFIEYRYNGHRNSFYLTLNYEGHTSVSGAYHLPAIGFDFGPDVYDTLSAHVLALRTAGYVPTSEGTITRPLWWLAPIFSGWGAQCYLASKERGQASRYARQELYEEFLSVLGHEDVEPGVVVIDDKWQATYGRNEVDKEKWPDLPGFVEHQHSRGQKVLLWLKLWDPEGVPAEQCITNAAGLPVSVDPTHPAFRQRLKVSVQRMLSPQGYNADGFKIDFSARIPSGPGIRCYGDSWGLELMKLYLSIIYETAKEVKPDALIMTHTPHPYLADVVDMIRLNDINTRKDVLKAMRHRARIASIACPNAVIDTDNWPIPDKATWRDYLALQTELGVPSLYYASHVDSTGEPLEAEDYQLIRDVWRRYRSRTELSR
ncbi:MAG TPA: hypothetical protein VF177_16135 [Anaerolineae bacterium]